MSAISRSADSHDAAGSFGARWNRFWFTPADPLSCCALRIVVGLAAALPFADLARGLIPWYAQDGLLPPATVHRLLELTTGDAEYHLSYLNQIGNSGEL